MKNLNIFFCALCFLTFISCESVREAAKERLKRDQQSQMNFAKKENTNILRNREKTPMDNLKILADFSPAKEDEERWVIWPTPLPNGETEEDYKIELIAGLDLEVDCNHYSLLGDIKEHNLVGIGYAFYTFETKGNITSTRMLCPEGKTEQRFIKAPSILVRYNSRLPIVVYVPKKYQLKTRVWSVKK